MTSTPSLSGDLEGTIIMGLVRLIQLCEQADLVFDLLANEAQRIHRGEPHFST